MPNQHTPTKAEACQQALESFRHEHQHNPDPHEKARLISDTIKEWEHDEVVATHPQNPAN